jgi:hypothetical protein
MFSIDSVLHHFMHELPAEVAAVMLVKGVHHASHHAHRFVVQLHIVERIKKVTLHLHNGERIESEQIETEVTQTITLEPDT